MKQSEKTEKGSKDEQKTYDLIPPDGGWGWFIVLGSILSAITNIPIIQNFTLMYKGRLTDLGMSSTDITTIISVNSAFGAICGVFQGPLLKKFGYRKLAIAAVLTTSVGACLTTFATTFTHFLITYGMISSIGFTFTYTAFSLAMNSYFKKKRSYASGLSQGCSGLGPIIFPHLITFFLHQYGVQGTAFLVAALNLHGLVGASLLQPISRHRIKVPLEGLKEEDETKIETESIFGSICSINLEPSRRLSSTQHAPRIRKPTVSSRYSSLDTLNEDMVKEQIEGLLEKGDIDIAVVSKNNSQPETPALPAKNQSITEGDKLGEKSFETSVSQKKKKNVFLRVWNYLYKLFDFDLLLQPTVLNIIIGISIAVIGELMFSMLTPYILDEKKLNLQQIALFLSISAGSDIVARFVAPYVGVKLKMKSRGMYTLSLLMLMLSRSLILVLNSYAHLLALAVFVGGSKGFRTVFWTQIIPDNVPYEKLPSAMSIQSFLNGIFILVSGPFIGWVVALNESYLTVIYTSNTLTLITITMWTIEFLIVFLKKKT